MWMEGDGVDGGGKVIKCCFSRGPLFSFGRSPAAAAASPSPRGKSASGFILLYLIAIFFFLKLHVQFFDLGDLRLSKKKKDTVFLIDRSLS